MRADYLESQQSSPINYIVPVTMSKLTSLKWTQFKNGITESLSRTIGLNHIPLVHVIRRKESE